LFTPAARRRDCPKRLLSSERLDHGLAVETRLQKLADPNACDPKTAAAAATAAAASVAAPSTAATASSAAASSAAASVPGSDPYAA
jgi:hypothetical protein